MSEIKGKGGIFLISIDFELNWGVLDRKNNQAYHSNILKGREVFLDVIRLFKKTNIAATVAVVGLLFNKSKMEMIDNSPDNIPNYNFKFGTPFPDYISSIGENEKSDPIHFGYDLVEEIKKQNNLEIGTHTYGHYYCLDDGHNEDSFIDDLNLALKLGAKNDIKQTSIIFPRNQINPTYLDHCKELGLTSYRGNESSWIYRKGFQRNTGLILRLIRICDAYFNLTGHNTYPLPKSNGHIVNLPSSSFFRPVRWRNKLSSKLKVRRIKNAMKNAACRNEIFHLWWHPHNFGKQEKTMMNELSEILTYYEYLNKTFGMKSLTMSQTAKLVNEE